MTTIHSCKSFISWYLDIKVFILHLHRSRQTGTHAHTLAHTQIYRHTLFFPIVSPSPYHTLLLYISLNFIHTRASAPSLLGLLLLLLLLTPLLLLLNCYSKYGRHTCRVTKVTRMPLPAGCRLRKNPQLSAVTRH